MRGKETSKPHSIPRLRIIPAHAGKSVLRRNYTISVGDHPRSCGEKTKKPLNSKSRTGSSPLMRGKVSFECADSLGVRIIPAHAGKSMSYLRQYRVIRDHPRSCGEKCRPCTTADRPLGSSPLMRGKVPPMYHSRPAPGIIPAHAGKRYQD